MLDVLCNCCTYVQRETHVAISFTELCSVNLCVRLKMRVNSVITDGLYKIVKGNIGWPDEIRIGPPEIGAAVSDDKNPINLRLTEGVFFVPLSFFSDISQSYKRIITKFAITFKPSIWHILTKRKLDTSDMSTTNDVRVTSCLPGFRQK